MAAGLRIAYARKPDVRPGVEQVGPTDKIAAIGLVSANHGVRYPGNTLTLVAL